MECRCPKVSSSRSPSLKEDKSFWNIRYLFPEKQKTDVDDEDQMCEDGQYCFLRGGGVSNRGIALRK